ncbi:MAG: hypothetical protein WD031_01920, partial [Gemmatimonadota bacterium]
TAATCRYRRQRWIVEKANLSTDPRPRELAMGDPGADAAEWFSRTGVRRKKVVVRDEYGGETSGRDA